MLVERVGHGKLPERKTPGAAGFDCYAAETIRVGSAPRKVRLGFRVQLPPHHRADIRPRSGLSLKGLRVELGTIDEDYRGEVCAIVSWRPGFFAALRRLFIPALVREGDRIAQMAISAVPQLDAVEGAVNIDTARGDGGFGSTGDR